MAAKYLTIAKELKKELRLMQQEGVRKLPSEAALAEKYSCSRQTIRAALAYLAENGLIVKLHGSGSYISDNVIGRSRRIAVIVPDRSEYIYPAIVRDLQSIFADKGYTVCCFNTDNRFLNEREILTELLADPPAGIIIEAINNVLPCMNLELLRKIEDAGIPTVYLHNAYAEAANVVCIGQDNYGGGYEAVKYLASKGHRSIAGIMKSDVVSGLERYKGCVQACLDFGLDFQESHFFWYSAESRKRLLESGEDGMLDFAGDFLQPCTAVVCYNDEIAFRLIRILRANHIEVPANKAIISFDNSYYCTAGDVGITSLGHAAHSTGNAAAHAMLMLLNGRKCRPVTLEWTLNERESV